jgi:hypothetical protein
MTLSGIRNSLIDISHARGSAMVPDNPSLYVLTGVWIAGVAMLIVFAIWGEHTTILVGYMACQIAVTAFGACIHNLGIMWPGLGQVFGSAIMLAAATFVGTTLVQTAILVAICFFIACIIMAIWR